MAHRRLARLVICCALVAGHAAAQTRDPAAAEVLFREGRDAMSAGRTAEACAKFAESHRLDPAAGTLINWAACEEKLGRLASAWEKWQRALRTLPSDDERRKGVEQRSGALEARVPHLEIRLAAGAPAGTRVLRDGVELGSASLGVALPVDPGKHSIEVRAPGHASTSVELTLAESEKKAIEVRAGKALPPEPPPKEPVSAARPAKSPAPRTGDGVEPEGGSSTLGWIALGTGAAGIVVGSVAGALALQKKGVMDDDCEDVGGTQECGADGLDAAESGRTYATVSTIGFGVGVVGLALGGWILLSGSSTKQQAAIGARALPGGGGWAGVAGAF